MHPLDEFFFNSKSLFLCDLKNYLKKVKKKYKKSKKVKKVKKSKKKKKKLKKNSPFKTH